MEMDGDLINMHNCDDDSDGYGVWEWVIFGDHYFWNFTLINKQNL